MLECIWVFFLAFASLCYSIGVALSDIYVPFSAPEETPEEEEDPDYQEDFEEEALPGATSHPTS